MNLQMVLFGEAVNVIPSETPEEIVSEWTVWDPDSCRYLETFRTIIGFPLPAATVYCDDCGDSARPMPTPTDQSVWYMPCCAVVCSSCEYVSETLCGECEVCEDCCDCHYCSHCCEMTRPRNVCDHCDNCTDCCECVECSRCSSLVSEECPESYHCAYCCDCETSCDCDSCTGNSEYIGCEEMESSGLPGSHIGVEIEFVGCDVYSSHSRNELMETLRSNGVEVRYTSDHDETSMRTWTLKPDGSVPNGGELVSPPMVWGADAKDQIRNALRSLRAMECHADNSTGIHVHVEAKNADGEKLSVSQLRRLAALCYANEDMIYRIAASSTGEMRRGAGTYAVPMTAECAARYADAKDLTGILQATYGSRYYGLNMQSFMKHDTVEFRYCNSTVEADRLIAQVSLFYALMQAAKDPNTLLPAYTYAAGDAYNGRSDEDTQLVALQTVVRPYDSAVQYMDIDEWNTLVSVCVKDSAPQCVSARF